MKLTLAYLRAHKVKALLLSLAFALTAFLPLALTVLVRTYQADLTARAAATPLVLGAKGDRYDLVLKSLYFSGPLESPLNAKEVSEIKNAIPLHLQFTAGGAPLVGTNLSYFKFRHLTPATGTLPLRLGDVILGSAVAKRLNLTPGDHLLTDQASLFNIAATYPLKMRITGVLKETNTPDDDAAFTDIKTTWTVAGIGHGHSDLEKSPEDVLTKNGTTLQASPAILQYNEITPENIGSFHFHGSETTYPVSSAIITPDTPKATTLLKGKFSTSETRQILVPNLVIAELLGVVFKIKRFLDRASWLVYAAAGLFTTLVVLLSLRLRQNEWRILTRIGCARNTIVKLQLQELGILLITGIVIAMFAASFFMKFGTGSLNFPN